MNVIFAGTPEFAREALHALLQAGFVVPLVLTQPDRPAGRGMQLQASPVKQLAQERGIAVAQPRSLRLDGKYPEDAASARQALLDAQADVMVVAAYGLILPQWVLDLPRLGCLNIHASVLPRWRGAAPIHRAIQAGDAETGVTIMQMDAGLDTGAMLRVETTAITEDDTTATLHDRLAAIGGRLVVDVLRQAQQEPLAATPQPQQGVTYAHKIDKAESRIDWTLSAATIARQVRAFDPFPGAATALADAAIKVWGCAVADAPTPADAAPGQVLAAGATGITVACGEGTALTLTRLQRAGGKRLAAGDFLHGFALAPGQRLQGRTP